MPGPTCTAWARVLYEMLAGEPPFTGPTAQAVIAKRFSGEVPRVRHVRPSVPESVEQAITRALAPVAADRFASAAEFARALQPTADRADRHDRPPLGDCRRPRPTTNAGGGDGPGARHPHRPRRAVRLAAEPCRCGRDRAGQRCWPCSRSRTWATRPMPTSLTAWPTTCAASSPARGLAVICPEQLERVQADDKVGAADRPRAGCRSTS